MICPIQTYINQRPGEIKHSCASILKIKNDFGWEPSIELKNWLEQSQKVINYEKENAKR